jgi:aryl-alcohol dehydrogenase-like predicted oxidoreductase
MRYKQLGLTELVVSELGFGAFGIGGDRYGNSYGPTSDDESVKAIKVALDHGCTFFDTADVYGHGHSETILARALKDAGKLQDVVIATKGGCNFYREPIAHDFSPEYIVKAVDASLKRLGRDNIDLFQLHNPSRQLIEDGAIFGVLEQLKTEGKIRYSGVSIHTVEEGLACIRSKKAATLQVVYNLFSQLQPDKSAEALLPHVTEAQIGLIAREPLANGYLTGKHGLGTEYESGDIRADFSMEERLLRVRLCESFKYFGRTGVTPAQLALRFVLDEPAVSTTIVGVKTSEQAIENFKTPDLPPFETLYGQAKEPADEMHFTVGV